MLQVDECTMNSHEYVLFRFGFDACSFVRSFVRSFVVYLLVLFGFGG